MATSPQAILFDLDNTLTNRRASIIAFARQFDKDFRHRHQMTQIDDIISIMHDADSGGYRPRKERWKMLQDRISWSEKPSADEMRDYWFSQLGYCAIGVKGLHNTLSELRNKGIQLGIITNGPTDLQNLTTNALNLRQYMDCVIVSETVGIQKPNKEIYEVALAEIKQAPSNVWFVGDNPATDLLGAYHMGMTTVWVHGHHDWTDTTFQPDYTVDNISEMLPLF
jgi:HAD superfamily hydrolase (TIGR01549 family)